jgi:CubicO group peptidase (beta-lactamase class C family)
MQMSRGPALLLFTLMSSAPSFADPVDDIVTAEMKRQHIPGLSVAVVKDGAIVKRAGYGLANVELGVVVTPETMFQSASVGKQFTAALVLLLAADGKLAIDAPVSNHLPDAPESWTKITPRELLSHTSGLAAEDPAIDLRKDYSEEELLQSAFTVPVIAAPGEKWSYSNLGYQVLGILCSRVGGRFYGDQLRERIFIPLGMSTRVISERVIVPNRAAGYDRENGELFNQAWVSPTLNTTADGSLYLTANDLALWSLALESNTPLSEAMRNESWTPVKLNDGSATDYGLGWHIGKTRGHRFVDHTGSWQGFNSYFVRYVNDRLAVIVLANRSRSRAYLIAKGIAAHYIPQLKSPDPPALTAQLLATTPFYLRGSMNGWDTHNRMRAATPGDYAVTVILETGPQQFKFASKDWSALILGAHFDEGQAVLEFPKPMEQFGDDLTLDVKKKGAYVFRLDARDPKVITLTISAAERR